MNAINKWASLACFFLGARASLPHPPLEPCCGAPPLQLRQLGTELGQERLEGSFQIGFSRVSFIFSMPSLQNT